jgi:hypothetical protein
MEVYYSFKVQGMAVASLLITFMVGREASHHKCPRLNRLGDCHIKLKVPQAWGT